MYAFIAVIHSRFLALMQVVVTSVFVHEPLKVLCKLVGNTF